MTLDEQKFDKLERCMGEVLTALRGPSDGLDRSNRGLIGEAAHLRSEVAGLSVTIGGMRRDIDDLKAPISCRVAHCPRVAVVIEDVKSLQKTSAFTSGKLAVMTGGGGVAGFLAAKLIDLMTR